MTRLNSKDRRAQIVDSALKVAAACGTDRMTFDAIASDAGVSYALVTHYLGTKSQLRRTVMREAVKRRVVSIVARGLAVDDPHARKADPTLRKLAAEYLSKQATA